MLFSVQVDTLLTDYPTITTKQCDFSIFDQQIVLSDAQASPSAAPNIDINLTGSLLCHVMTCSCATPCCITQGFQVEGIRAYRTFFSVVPTLVNVCFSKVQVSAMLMDKHGIDKARP
jgi:hypothetical protein